MHCRAVGPVHLHWERHIFKEGFCGIDVLDAVGGEGDHQTGKSRERGQGVADQAQCRAVEFLHQTRNQQSCGSLPKLLVEFDGVEIAKAVIMNRGDQALLKIHAVFDATTKEKNLSHT